MEKPEKTHEVKCSRCGHVVTFAPVAVIGALRERIALMQQEAIASRELCTAAALRKRVSF